MSLVLDIFSIGKEVMSATMKANRAQKLQVAEHFQNLSSTFMAFPPAHRAKDRDKQVFLVAKTDSIIQSLKGSAVFSAVLGGELESKFFGRISEVLNEKELMADGKQLEGRYSVIVSAAGFLEGYAESLRAQAGKS